jgi:hypothetical protein
MDVNSGRFTAPVSGLYYFNLNVYGAPRDGVVLSIKYVSAVLTVITWWGRGVPSSYM